MIEKFFYFLILFFPFSFALNPWEEIDLSSVRVLIIPLFLLWLGKSLAQKKLLIDKRPRFWFGLMFLFWIGLSLLWSFSPERTLRKIIFFFSFFPLYFVSFSLANKNKEKVLKIILVSSFLLALLGIVQFFLQFIWGLEKTLELWKEYLAPFFLGENFSKTVLSFPSWLVNIQGRTILRSFGSFPDPHLFSLFLNFTFPFTVFFWKKTKKNVFLLMAIFFVLGIFLSFSRAAYFSFLAMCIFLFLTPLKIIVFLKKKPLLFLVSFSLFLGIIFIPNPLSQRFYSSFNFKEGSNQGRIEMWEKAWSVFQKKPFLGTGLGAFSYFIDPLADYRVPIYAHNLFLDFLAEIGLIGFILFFIFLFSPLFYYIFKKNPQPLNRYLTAAFIVLLVHSFFETPVFSVNLFPLIIILLSFENNS